ncbi:MAG: hypothetical protein LBI48_11520 [Burkholderiaceae bacterium]|jgi:uncharacterized coiled-coil protein SlyX|nr:hypothetical protein [Burkholderiaceae bacterium]
MLDDATKNALQENGGSILGLLGAGAAAFWGLWKVLPVFNSNMDNAAKAGAIQGNMLTLLIDQNDKRRLQYESLEKRYEEVFKSEATLRAQASVSEKICTELREQLAQTRALMAEMHAHMKRASKIIDAAPPAPASHDTQGEHDG